MSIIRNLIRIRFKQLFREIRDMGMLRAAVLFVVLLPMLILFLFRKLPGQHYGYVIPGAALLLVFMIHRNRRDNRLLRRIASSPEWVYYAEYLVFSVPFIAILVVCRQYIPALLYTVLLLPVCLVAPSPEGAKVRNTWFVSRIPSGMFEWQSGFRTNYAAIVLFYLLGLAGIYNIWFVAASTSLLLLVYSSFYTENEPQKMLAAPELSTAGFLKCKLARHTSCWALFLLPLLFIALIHYEYWLYALSAFVAAINLAVFAILLKYAFYRPASSGSLLQITGALGWLCTLMLPLSAFVFTANIILFFKAKRNLNFYLYAYH